MVITDWNEFKHLDFARIRSQMKQPVIFDGRNIYDPETMGKLGFVYRGFGRGYNGSRLNAIDIDRETVPASS